MSDLLELSLQETFSSVAHQWRQPLSKINSLVGSIDNRLYELGVEDDFLSQQLLEIERLTQSMSKVIDDFRFNTDVCKSDTDRRVIDIIKEALSSLAYSLEEKSIELNIDADASLVVEHDEKLLKQVIITLIDNARDALIERNIYNPFIKVSAFENSEALFIKVCDNAGGISKSIMSRVFEPGFSTKHSSEGTGLGLYMSKRLLKEKLDAQLEVKNVESGVCFIITLNKG